MKYRLIMINTLNTLYQRQTFDNFPAKHRSQQKNNFFRNNKNLYETRIYRFL